MQMERNPYKNPDKWLSETLNKANYEYERMRRVMQVLQANIANPNLLDIFNYIESLYNTIDRFNISTYLKTSEYLYEEAWGYAKKIKNPIGPKTNIDYEWLMALLATFNSVTKYVYIDEVQAKSAYFNKKLSGTLKAQSEQKRKLSMYSADVNSVFREAKNLWANMADSTLVFVGTHAMVKAYNDVGISKVIYHTEDDGKVCEKCEPLEGKVIETDKLIYGINAPAIHNYCRCWLEPLE